MEGGAGGNIEATDGMPDLTLDAPLPALHDAPSRSRVGANSMIHLIEDARAKGARVIEAGAKPETTVLRPRTLAPG